MVERSADARIRTTEWEDLQFKHGNCVGQYRTKELEIKTQKILDKHQYIGIEAFDRDLERAKDKAERGGFDTADGGIPDPEAGSNSDDDSDDDVLAAFRARRREQIGEQNKAAQTGRLVKADAASYVTEITDASAGDKTVLVLLYSLGNPDCDRLIKIFEQLAPRNREVKFVQMLATEASKNFPTKQTPCVLVYNNKSVASQFSGIQPWGGAKASVSTAEDLMAVTGIISHDRVGRRRGGDDDDDDGGSEDDGPRGHKQFTRY